MPCTVPHVLRQSMQIPFEPTIDLHIQSPALESPSWVPGRDVKGGSGPAGFLKCDQGGAAASDTKPKIPAICHGFVHAGLVDIQQLTISGGHKGRPYT